MKEAAIDRAIEHKGEAAEAPKPPAPLKSYRITFYFSDRTNYIVAFDRLEDREALWKEISSSLLNSTLNCIDFGDILIMKENLKYIRKEEEVLAV